MRVQVLSQPFLSLLQTKLDELVRVLRIEAFRRDHNIPGLLDENWSVSACVSIQSRFAGISRQVLEPGIARAQSAGIQPGKISR